MKWLIGFGIAALVIAGLGLMAEQAFACRVIPSPMPIIRPGPDRPPQRGLETRSHSAEVVIRGPVATVTLNAIFYNPNPFVMEGTYFFPLESGAAVDNFEMNINGQMVKGELLDSDKARGIYEDIVRRMRDPGLLEFVGTQMIKCRVFPMNPNSETKVRLTYSMPLRQSGGLYEFNYPLRSARPEVGRIGSMALRVRIEEQDGIRTVYSPTHRVDTNRKNDREVTLGFEESNFEPDKDFRLYFDVTNRDIGLSVVTNKTAGEDGYFLLGIAPKVEEEPGQVTPKSILFVLDTSGSMAGDKIRQAKAALQYCVNSLKPADTFGLISFATEPVPFRDQMLPATPENVKAALEFIEKIEARGGTAINDALLLALKTMHGSKGLPMVVFLTDGLPTIGETSIETILKNIQGANTDRARLFDFGIGYEVNTALLDKLAEENHGSSDYVTEKENIEVKVSNFYQKVANPVLADVRIEIPGMKAYDIYPRQLPDLFRGTQLMVLGRYDAGGHRAIKLSGTVNGKAREFVYETSFADTSENSFLPRLWSTRKVAFLLDEIRLRGRNQELVDEIVRLGKRYGILTPYTSFLVVEDGEHRPMAMRGGAARDRLEREERSGQGAFDLAREAGASRAHAQNQPLPPAGPKGMPSAPATLGFGLEARDEVARAAAQSVVQIEDKTFYRKPDGFLYDSLYDEARDKANVVEIRMFSDEYFTLVRQNPRIGRYLAGGQPMVILFDGKIYRITKAT